MTRRGMMLAAALGAVLATDGGAREEPPRAQTPRPPRRRGVRKRKPARKPKKLPRRPRHWASRWPEKQSVIERLRLNKPSGIMSPAPKTPQKVRADDRAELCALAGVKNSGRQWRILRKKMSREERAMRRGAP